MSLVSILAITVRPITVQYRQFMGHCGMDRIASEFGIVKGIGQSTTHFFTEMYFTRE